MLDFANPQRRHEMSEVRPSGPALRLLTLCLLGGDLSSLSLGFLCKLSAIIPPGVPVLARPQGLAQQSAFGSWASFLLIFLPRTTASLSNSVQVILIRPHVRSSAAFPRHRTSTSLCTVFVHSVNSCSHLIGAPSPSESQPASSPVGLHKAHGALKN